MEQQIDRIYGLLATLQEGMSVVRPMVEAEHQKLLAISKSSSVFVNLSSTNLDDIAVINAENTTTQMQLQKMQRDLELKENEVAILKDERQNYLIERDQLNDILQILSEDYASLENEIRNKEQLQEQIYHLNEIILERNNVISQLQIENSRIRAENSELLKEIAEAIQVDEDNTIDDSS
ncbi:uncharacterized protein [Blastocystis hominis]|uniref:Uncharacterized protein n=1 Tax=Blastocystis hominis TaxID=12968 RepID=D8M0F0_BLAHO|nr:uncharacterized protein [Blastocystis hominis]CBK21539.2 unnamed protein product [Blastocystis hominis]|eukprot:XP_012895587.1 uncharacterized protein [Blastocystis hominis]